MAAKAGPFHSLVSMASRCRHRVPKVDSSVVTFQFGRSYSVDHTQPIRFPTSSARVKPSFEDIKDTHMQNVVEERKQNDKIFKVDEPSKENAFSSSYCSAFQSMVDYVVDVPAEDYKIFELPDTERDSDVYSFDNMVYNRSKESEVEDLYRNVISPRKKRFFSEENISITIKFDHRIHQALRPDTTLESTNRHYGLTGKSYSTREVSPKHSMLKPDAVLCVSIGETLSLPPKADNNLKSNGVLGQLLSYVESGNEKDYSNENDLKIGLLFNGEFFRIVGFKKSTDDDYYTCFCSDPLYLNDTNHMRWLLGVMAM
eukprot:jgi/Bigna1/75685/fgenesh1_pg.36_\